MNEAVGLFSLVFMLALVVAGVVVFVAILRWMLKIERIVFRLDQIAQGMEQLNKTMAAAHPPKEASTSDSSTT